jgi:ribonuclease BN (tRNA processing enzyme)
VKVTLVPSALDANGEQPYQFLTSYLLNDTVAIDAGSLGFYHGPGEQLRVKHVLLSHSHMDHLASLPVFLENVYQGKRDSVIIYGSVELLDSLRRDVFNNRLWPDFIGLSTEQAPFLRLQTLEAGKTVEIDGLRITPVPVDHAVPTLGFVVEDATSAVILPVDTGPTEEIWQYANRTANLRAIFLETTFPDSMNWLATVSGHLTPALFAQETRKVQAPVQYVIVHIKPAYRTQVVQEMAALGLPNVEIGEPGRTYSF